MFVPLIDSYPIETSLHGSLRLPTHASLTVVPDPTDPPDPAAPSRKRGRPRNHPNQTTETIGKLGDDGDKGNREHISSETGDPAPTIKKHGHPSKAKQATMYKNDEIKMSSSLKEMTRGPSAATGHTPFLGEEHLPNSFATSSKPAVSTGILKGISVKQELQEPATGNGKQNRSPGQKNFRPAR